MSCGGQERVGQGDGSLTHSFVTLGYAAWLVQEYACMIR